MLILPSPRWSKTFVMLRLSRVARVVWSVIESGPRVHDRLYGRWDTSACHWAITFYAMSDIPSTHDLCTTRHTHTQRERERERHHASE